MSERRGTVRICCDGEWTTAIWITDEQLASLRDGSAGYRCSRCGHRVRVVEINDPPKRRRAVERAG